MIYQQLVKKSVSYSDMKNILKNEAEKILISLQYDPVLHRSFIASHMYGRYLVLKENERTTDYADIDVKPVSLPIKEAIEYWQKKVPIDPKRFYSLIEEYRVNAFTVSGVGGMDMINDMYRSLSKALQKGESFQQWKSQYNDLWKNKGWTGKSAWRVDNIFRTNIQTAYNVGRYSQMVEVVDSRPYWMYSAINDSRTRPTHIALNEKVFPHDHEFWDIFYPPNGFRCRCTVITLSERQVKKMGKTIEKLNPYGGLIEPIDPKTQKKLPARPLMPDRGFEGNPAKQHYEPDLSKYPDWLKKAFEDFQAKQKPVSEPKPEPKPKLIKEKLKQFKSSSNDILTTINEFETFLDKEIDSDPLKFFNQLIKEAPKNRKLSDVLLESAWDKIKINKVSKKYIVEKFEFVLQLLDDEIYDKLKKNKCNIIVNKNMKPETAAFYSNRTKTINVRPRDDDWTNYLHEYGHHIEEIIGTVEHSARWRDSKSKKVKVVKGKPYAVNDKNEYVRDYTGRIYKDSSGKDYATEVVSTMFEEIYNDLSFKEAYNGNKSQTSYIIGLLTGVIKK